MKTFCLFFDKKYKCVSFIVHYKGLTLMPKPCSGDFKVSCQHFVFVSIDALLGWC